MGRHRPSVGVLYQKEKNVASFSYQQAKNPEQNNQNDGNEPGRLSINDQLHVFASSSDFQEKITKNEKGKKKKKKKANTDKKDCASIHIWGVGTQRNGNRDVDKRGYIRNQQADNKLESTKNTSIAVVSFERCPNRRIIQEIEPPLGELFRVGSLVGSGKSTWTTEKSTWTTEDPTSPCCRVLPNRTHTQKNKSDIPMCNVSEDNGPYESSKACNNSHMLVEKIKNEYDRHRVAASVSHDILSESKESDLTDLIIDMEFIKRYGFNHIIIVGQLDYGILFLDCYGRMFYWDYMDFLLWPLGNYLEHDLDKPRVAWGVEFDGTITEFETDN